MSYYYIDEHFVSGRPNRWLFSRYSTVTNDDRTFDEFALHTWYGDSTTTKEEAEEAYKEWMKKPMPPLDE